MPHQKGVSEQLANDAKHESDSSAHGYKAGQRSSSCLGSTAGSETERRKLLLLLLWLHRLPRPRLSYSCRLAWGSDMNRLS